jgi:hypothetical protein
MVTILWTRFMESDAVLVRRAREGDREAFAGLVERLQAFV